MAAIQQKKSWTEGAYKFLEAKRPNRLFYTKLLTGSNDPVHSTKLILPWESREMKSSIAKDQVPNTKGHANAFNSSTLKQVTGVEFHETMNLNQILTSMIGFTDTETSDGKQYAQFIRDVERNTQHIFDMIANADELQSAQILTTGVTLFENNVNYNWGRPATSIIDVSAGTGEFWSTVTSDIEAQHNGVRQYFSQTARVGSMEFDEIMSTAAWLYFKKTNFFTANKESYQETDIQALRPSMFDDASGATYMRTMVVGGAKFHIWICDNEYEDPTFKRFVDENLVIIVPTSRNIAELTTFPIDAIITKDGMDAVGYVQQAIYSYTAKHPDSDTLERHFKSRRLNIPYREKQMVTLKVFADA